MVERIDHIEQGKKLLFSQFKDSPIINGILESLLSPVQDLEDTLHDYMGANTINTAYGDTLDIIGEQFGEKRKSRDDTSYRSAILARILSQFADGTTENFISGLRAITGSPYCTFVDYYPDTVYAYVGGGNSPTLHSDISRIKPAGSHLRVLMDVGFDSIRFVETDITDSFLENELSEIYQIDLDGQLQNLNVNIRGGGKTEDNGMYLAEPEDKDYWPFAEEIDTDPIRQEDILQDENGEFVLDENGRRFTVVSYNY